MATSSKITREKLSTTVSAETYQFLQQMINDGQVESLAEAVDAVVKRIQRLENRRRLAEATAKYFDSMSSRAIEEEAALAADFSAAAGAIDFDNEI